ncbi:hypothetical protein Gotur_011389 [Gossypium turneri]
MTVPIVIETLPASGSFSWKRGHSHSHNQPMEKMVVASLVLVPALSPCATTLLVFLTVGNSSSMISFRYSMIWE